MQLLREKLYVVKPPGDGYASLALHYYGRTIRMDHRFYDSSNDTRIDSAAYVDSLHCSFNNIILIFGFAPQ